MRSCDDGFALAQMDLKIRGRGDLLGTQQSGFNNFRFFDADKHDDLVLMALHKAKDLYSKNKTLSGHPVSVCLKIFNKNKDYKDI
jgi:ATP-dependent DNA helicase RecG